MQTATGRHVVNLSDGRTAKVSEYEDDSVRVMLKGKPGYRYAITECFLPGDGQDAIIKLVVFPAHPSTDAE
jgi:hypothetical protein